MRALLGAFVVLMLLVGEAFSQSPDKKDLPKPLSDDVVKAWEDAGAKVSWIKKAKSGSWMGIEKPEEGAIPNLEFEKWKAGVIEKLPPPNTPFYLSLSLTGVTDAGLKELAHLKNLTVLQLNFTRITNAGLKELGKLENLTELGLDVTKVTDEGLKELAAIKNLTSLQLAVPGITDKGVKELVKLEKLTYIHLIGTKVTKEGVAELQKALPKCKIER